MSSSLWWASLSFVLLAAACSKPKPPAITAERAAVTSVGPAGIGFLVELGVDNPNSVDLAARSVTARVLLDGKYDLGALNVEKPLTLVAGKRTPLAVPLQLKWQDLSAMVALAGSHRSVPYEVEGTVTLGGEMLHADLPFHLTGTLTHDELVKATVSSLPQLRLP